MENIPKLPVSICLTLNSTEIPQLCFEFSFILNKIKIGPRSRILFLFHASHIAQSFELMHVYYVPCRHATMANANWSNQMFKMAWLRYKVPCQFFTDRYRHSSHFKSLFTDSCQLLTLSRVIERNHFVTRNSWRSSLAARLWTSIIDQLTICLKSV